MCVVISIYKKFFKVDLCNPSPCQNATTCKDLGDAFHCVCKTGFTGKKQVLIFLFVCFLLRFSILSPTYDS